MGLVLSTNDAVERIRGQLDHPIIDADGHQIEFLPLVYEIAAEIAGRDVADRLRSAMRGRGTDGKPGRVGLPSWGLFPARNTLDRVSVTLPKLLYRRLDEVGIDFSLMYPTFGAVLTPIQDDEVRQVLARSLNVYAAEVFAEYRDRLEPVAAIPMVTPDEAIAELDHAVGELGLKAVVMEGAVARPERVAGQGPWIDTLGYESVYDYSPVWERCRDLGVAATFHGVGNGWGTRTSRSNFVYNHLGHFACAQEGICRSLIMGGVPRRFPTLRFGFLEGGVSWAAQLFSDLLGHYEKRNKEVVAMYDPAEQDAVLRDALYREFGDGRFALLHDRIEEGFMIGGGSHRGDPAPDDFADALISDPDQIIEIFQRQFSFGCEADDSLNAVAFDTQLMPHQTRLNAMFASDVGHFDVPDIRGVLLEAWEPVEHGLIGPDDFRRFTCTNVMMMVTAGNPGFFKGTSVEDYAQRAIPVDQ